MRAISSSGLETCGGALASGRSGYPAGFVAVCVSVAGERFSGYLLLSQLLLYLSEHAGFSVAAATSLVGYFVGLAYFLPLLGGLLADRVLGPWGAGIAGTALAAAGYCVLGIDGAAALYAGLGLIVVGSGLYKASPQALTDYLYGTDDRRREAGFSLLYVMVNLGAFLGPVIGTYVRTRYGWRGTFVIASASTLLSHLSLAVCHRRLRGTAPTKVVQVVKDRWLGDPASRTSSGVHLRHPGGNYHPVLSGAPCPASSGAHPRHPGVTNHAVPNGAPCPASSGAHPCRPGGNHPEVLSSAPGSASSGVRPRHPGGNHPEVLSSPPGSASSGALPSLCLAALLFTVAQMQSTGALLLWARDHTERHVLGREVPVTYFAALPALLVMVLSPLVALAFQRLGRWGRVPSTATKLKLGMLLTAVAYVPLVAAALRSPSRGLASMVWLLVCMLCLATGELLVSALGPSIITRQAPPHCRARWLSTWFACIALGCIAAGKLGALWGTVPPAHYFVVVLLIPLVGVGTTLAANRCRRARQAAGRRAQLESN